MPKKTRTPIPEDIAAEILFRSDRTCCVCNIRGKNVQIHHIDENPANNSFSNLSVVCLECHNHTMIKGGFGRKLDAGQVIRYRDEWLDRVSARKTRADELASADTLSSTEQDDPDEDYLEYKTLIDHHKLIDYLNKTLIIKQAQFMIAQTKWDNGKTAEMNQASYDIIDFYQDVLIELATFYPKGHFNNESPGKYFGGMIRSRFLWHRLVLEPGGTATGGTIVSTMTGGSVMADCNNMIIDMVNALAWPYEIDEHINLDAWRKAWME